MLHYLGYQHPFVVICYICTVNVLFIGIYLKFIFLFPCMAMNVLHQSIISSNIAHWLLEKKKKEEKNLHILCPINFGLFNEEKNFKLNWFSIMLVVYILM